MFDQVMLECESQNENVKKRDLTWRTYNQLASVKYQQMIDMLWIVHENRVTEYIRRNDE
jgi:hypothetical protein